MTTLYQIRWKQVEQLLATGRETVDQLEEVETGYKEARRQIRAVRTRRRIVEEGLGEALDALVPPVAWLDFESVGLAIPAWPMVAPHENVPVQFSAHVSGAGDETAHEWIAEPHTDPRPALAEALVRACGSARTVVAYNAKFEKDCLKHLAAAVLAYRDVLRDRKFSRRRGSMRDRKFSRRRGSMARLSTSREAPTCGVAGLQRCRAPGRAAEGANPSSPCSDASALAWRMTSSRPSTTSREGVIQPAPCSRRPNSEGPCRQNRGKNRKRNVGWSRCRSPISACRSTWSHTVQSALPVPELGPHGVHRSRLVPSGRRRFLEPKK